MPHRRTIRLLVAALLSLAPAVGVAEEPSPAQRAAVRQLVDQATRSQWGYQRLRELCETIGPRPAGSKAMQRATAWAESAMMDAGLVNVHREPVTVPHWIRGPESARLVSPIDQPLAMLSLGPSISTPPGGLTAPVVVVDSYEELDRLGRPGVEGKIVLFDYPWTTYPAAAEFRSRGPARAAALGAVAGLVRSATPKNDDTPHTAWLKQPAGVPKIPAAALSPMGAGQVRRLVEAGHDVRLHLEMTHESNDTTRCHNVLGEIRGSEYPEEIVLLGAHLDSWDVGQGALDDGVGCLIMLEAARLIRALPHPPRRTIRVVFFTDEEVGLGGAYAYAELHLEELPRHVAGFESDMGNEVATGFFIDVQGVAGKAGVKADSLIGGRADSTRTAREARQLAGQVLARLAEFDWAMGPLGASGHLPGDSGLDIEAVVAEGMPGLGVNHPTEKYFDVHHSALDTFDRVDVGDMARNVARVAVMAYLVADSKERLLPLQPR